MPINIGDAVLSFVADTTQLDQAFAQVGSDASAKLAPASAAVQKLGDDLVGAGTKAQVMAGQMTEGWQRVAQATVQNNQAQAELKAALDRTKASGDQDVVSMLALAEAQKKAAAASLELAAAQRAVTPEMQHSISSFREAQGTLALVGAEAGVNVPRHLRTFIATLPGVGAAMSAAFSVTAVLILLDILVKAGEKVVEFAEREDKMRQQQVEIDHAFQTTGEHIQEGIEQQKQKFVELTAGPVAGLDYALRHMGSTAESTWAQMSADLDKLIAHFKSQESALNPVESAAKDAAKFKTEVTAAMDAVRAANASLRASGQAGLQDLTAEYRVGLQKTEEEIDRVTKKLDEFKIAEAAAAEQASTDASIPIVYDTKSLDEYLVKLKQLRDFQQAGQQEDVQRQITQGQQLANATAKQQEAIGQAQLEGQKTVATARIAEEEETNKALYDRGQISYAQMIAAQRGFEQQRYDIDESTLRGRIALLQGEQEANVSALLNANQRVAAAEKAGDDARVARESETQSQINQARQQNTATIIGLQAQLEALNYQHQERILKTDQQAYDHDVEENVKWFQQLIAATRQGSDERIALQEAFYQYLAGLGEKYADRAKQEENAITKTEQDAAKLRMEIAKEEASFEEKSASESAKSQVAYYQYLVSTFRASKATLQQIQAQAAEAEYQSQHAALERELADIKGNGAAEVLARQKVTDQIALLDQKEEQRKRLEAAKTADILELYYKDLGIKSAQSYQLQAENALRAYAAILTSGKATQNELWLAQEKLTAAAAEYRLVLGKDPSPGLKQYYHDLLQEQELLLQATIAYKQALGMNASSDIQQLDRLRASYDNVHNSLKRLDTGTAHLSATQKLQEGTLKILTGDVKTYGTNTEAVAGMVAGAMETMSNAFLQGQFSIEKSLAAVADAMLGAIAKVADKKGEEQIAEALGSWPDAPAMAYHFAAAAAWFALGAGLSAAGGAAMNATSGTGAPGTSTSLTGQNPETASTTTVGTTATTGTTTPPAQTNPTQGQNAQHYAAGGVHGEQGPAPGSIEEKIQEVVQGPRGGVGAAKSPKLAVYDEGDYPEAHIPLVNGESIPIAMNREGTPAAQLPDGRTIPAHFATDAMRTAISGAFLAGVIHYALGGATRKKAAAAPPDAGPPPPMLADMQMPLFALGGIFPMVALAAIVQHFASGGTTHHAAHHHTAHHAATHKTTKAEMASLEEAAPASFFAPPHFREGGLSGVVADLSYFAHGGTIPASERVHVHHPHVHHVAVHHPKEHQPAHVEVLSPSTPHFAEGGISAFEEGGVEGFAEGGLAAWPTAVHHLAHGHVEHHHEHQVKAPHYAEGGIVPADMTRAADSLITAPTLARMGQSIQTASEAQQQTASPSAGGLSEPNAVEQIIEGLEAKLGGGGAPITVNNHFQGVISNDNLNKMVKKISRNVSKGATRLVSTNTFKLTKRG